MFSHIPQQLPKSENSHRYSAVISSVDLTQIPMVVPITSFIEKEMLDHSLHLVVLFLQFLSISFLFMIFACLKATGQSFCGISLLWVCVMPPDHFKESFYSKIPQK